MPATTRVRTPAPAILELSQHQERRGAAQRPICYRCSYSACSTTIRVSVLLLLRVEARRTFSGSFSIVQNLLKQGMRQIDLHKVCPRRSRSFLTQLVMNQNCETTQNQSTALPFRILWIPSVFGRATCLFVRLVKFIQCSCPEWFLKILFWLAGNQTANR